MAQLVGNDEIESLRVELAEIGRSLIWGHLENLRSSLFDENDGSNVDAQGKRVVDVTKLGALERNMFIDKLIKHIENDNLRLLHKLRKRIDNILFDCAKLPGLKSQEAKITIIDDVSGIIKPGRTTLFLGPPGCGKTTLLKALSGKLSKSLKAVRERGGSLRKKLCAITGAFRPGVLTGLMGVSGARETTLMDVLAGRKTSPSSNGLQQKYTQSGGRPFVLSTLIVGFDPHTGVPSLYQIDPSGTFSAWKANATGRNSNSMRDFLEKNYKETSGQEIVKLAIRALLEVVESGGKTIEVAVMTKEHGLRQLEEEEIDAIVAEIEAEKDAAEATNNAKKKDSAVEGSSSGGVTANQSERKPSNLSRRDGNQRPSKMDFEVPPTEHVPRAFAKEVLEIIEFYEIKDCLVGMPGVSGLSTEQRKRLTIDLELVANPSIIFMDEPTTGLDARAAAIVMRAVKNVAETGRTIVCTIHQPSIDIFEAFGELILLKAGGQVIYSGPLGQHSSSVIEYFEAISGVQKIRNNYNPATWMLEITSRSAEAQLCVDFTQVYKNCVLYQNNKEHVNRWSTPPPGSKELYFASRFSQNGWGQFKSCLWKQHLSYWRSPSYNLLHFTYMLIASLFFGILFWDQGRKINSQQGVFNALVLPYVATERSRCMVMVEVPYLLVQAIAFVIISYSMIGYYWSACKVFWYFYAMFCTFLYFTYLGMLFVALTPAFPVAAILQSAFYTMLSLFFGYLIPQPHQWMKITESGWRKLVCSKKSSENLLLRMQFSNFQVVDMDVLSNSEPCTLNGLDHRRGLCAGPIKI
ncbi:unnamed protein product [Camellia sinensis]